MYRHLAVDLLELLLEFRYAVADNTAVGLNLALTGTTTSTRTSSLSLEVGPQTGQSGQHILILRQLHLCLGVGRAGTRHKDVENKACAVDYATRHCLLDITCLRRRELIIEDGNIDGILFAVVCNLLEFTRSDIYA